MLNLHGEAFLFNALGLIVCTIIIIACVCRINVTEAKRWRMTLEQVMLIAFAFWAAGTFVDLWRGRLIGFHGAAAGAGIIIYLVLSFRQWHLQQVLLREARAREELRAQRTLHWEDSNVHSIHC